MTKKVQLPRAALSQGSPRVTSWCSLGAAAEGGGRLQQRPPGSHPSPQRTRLRRALGARGCRCGLGEPPGLGALRPERTPALSSPPASPAAAAPRRGKGPGDVGTQRPAAGAGGGGVHPISAGCCVGAAPGAPVAGSHTATARRRRFSPHPSLLQGPLSGPSQVHSSP